MTFLNPKSVALLGSSSKTVDEAMKEGKYWGAALTESLNNSCKVPLYLVGKNDKYLDLPETPDLAILCVPNILEEVSNVLKKGTKYIIVINNLETDVEKQLYELTDNKAKLLGPNCMGIHCDTYSTFLLNKETKGDIGFITQSGGIGEAVCDSVDDIRTVISIGRAEKTTINDAVKMLKTDKNIKRIALYSESYKAKDKNVITMMPKFNCKSIEAVKQHSKQKLWCKSNVINNLEEFINVLNRKKMLVVSNSGGWLCLYAGEHPYQNATLIDTHAEGYPVKEVVKLQNNYDEAVLFINKFEKFRPENVDVSKINIPYTLIKSSSL
tara:strand:- start:35455 stop:36429 length:975 start_codon:yes stop_codon:yes gene_type:complete